MAKKVIDAKQASNENVDTLQGNYTEDEDRWGGSQSRARYWQLC
jgi:hypothetical protein